MQKINLIGMSIVLLFISGCCCDTSKRITGFKETITDEWLEEHAECDGDTCKVYDKDNPCLVFPNHNKTITKEMIEECCDEEYNCRFESPQYKLIGY